ncbi:hypothetical protein K1T73_03565 [Roseovarius sp. SCSIO 43702]|uniref:hypothetical protein n=1 Tax=Roseovarius sp. SCSIO 43702 TaxID=2823043 RepID=UPI001C734D81|nr:hypothetical protein [Roseovarius sp. SCSIO 43702]QYX57490.1 hypothetical protein K1T73_03565 [Roseovarius sp. SCSIO 43702]
MIHIRKDPTVERGVIALLRRERDRARSRAEWERALRGHGYALDRTATGLVVTTLPHGVEICRLPGDLA